MKKQYKTPEIKVVNINAADIICTSVSFYSEGDPIETPEGMY